MLRAVLAFLFVTAPALAADLIQAPTGTPSTIAPVETLSDSNGVGVPIPEVAGAPFYIHGPLWQFSNIGSRGAWPSFINNSIEQEGAGGNNPGQIILRLYGRGNSDLGLEGWHRRGTAADPSGIFYPSATLRNDMLMKMDGFGYCTNGPCPSNGATIVYRADSDFSNTGIYPTMANSSYPTNMLFGTTAAGVPGPNTVGIFDQSGALLLGNWPSTGNAMPVPAAGAGAGWIVLKDSPVPVAPVSGATVLQSFQGQPVVFVPSQGGAQYVGVQYGPATPGHPVCWVANGFIGNC